MKVAPAAIASLVCIQCAWAFVVPQCGSRACWGTKIEMQQKCVENLPASDWVGCASAVFAGLTVASQAADAAGDLTMGPTLANKPVDEVVNGKLAIEIFYAIEPY